MFIVYRRLGGSPTGKSYSFRSCVRASEAVCARGTMLFPWLGCGSSRNAPGCRGVGVFFFCVTVVVLLIIVKSMLIIVKSMLNAFR